MATKKAKTAQKEAPAQKTVCPQCGAESHRDIDLREMPIKRFPDGVAPLAPGKNEFEFTLPVSGKRVVFKLMTGADDQEFLMAAVRAGQQLDLPFLGTLLVVVLLYADDMALVATSAAGLQAQLGVLAEYCERSAIVVNTAKTKVLLLAGARTAAAAVAKA